MVYSERTEISEVLKVYSQRSGIEAMFKDCKTGGYNLEGSKAHTQRLTNLVLLIAIATRFAQSSFAKTHFSKRIFLTNEF